MKSDPKSERERPVYCKDCLQRIKPVKRKDGSYRVENWNGTEHRCEEKTCEPG